MTGKPRPCVHCGSIFTPEFPRGAARTCSEECSDERRKAVARACDRRNAIKNKEKIKARDRKRFRRDRVARSARWKEWAAKNRDAINARKRTAYAARQRRQTEAADAHGR